MAPPTLGALILDTQGAVVHATGIARSCATQAAMCLLVADLKAGRASGPQCMTVDGAPRRVQVLRCVDSDIVLVYDELPPHSH